MADTEDYADDMAYLREQVRVGRVSTSNSIYQKLDGKRNLRGIDTFLTRQIDPHTY